MAQDPQGDPIEQLRKRALDGDLPTEEVARLLGDASDRTQIRAGSVVSEPTIHSAAAPGPGAPSRPAAPPQGRPFGRYVFLEELGHGGMGVVWKAWDTQLQRIVALKGMIAEEFAKASQVERFMREARAAAHLSHPNIVPVYDVGEHEGQHYFTTEFIEGRPLNDVMQKSVPVKQALAWVKAIAEALSYAHRQGIVHRDVKPGNVLIDKEDQPHVMDFGLAKHVDAEGSKPGPTLTVSGDILGTPRYMSPEQTRGAQNAGAPSDQFSLGVVMYELLAGTPPFDATDMRSLLNAVAEQEPVRPTSLNPRIHRDIETICLKALEKDPARRYPSIGDLAADIGRYLDGEPIAARPATGLSRLWRKAARHKAVVLAAAAGLALALGSGVYAVAAHFLHVRAMAQALDRVTRANRETEAALARERAAKDVLEKSYAVSTVFSRWADLTDTLRGMEGVFYDASLPPGQRRERTAAAWEQVRGFMDGTEKDSASQATMWALAGWARRLAGYPEEGEAWMQKATALDSDVPYGVLLRAAVLFADYLDAQPLPETWTGEGAGLKLERLPDEAPEMRRRREEALPLLAQADRAQVWGSRETRQCRAALEAMRAMQKGAYAEAVKDLSLALAGPALRWMETSLLLARGRGRYLSMDLDGARLDLERVVQVRPGDGEVWNDLGLIAQAAAHQAARKGDDARAQFHKAIEDFGRAVAAEPSRSLFHRNRGTARADAGDAAGALPDLDEAVRLDARSVEAWVNRGTVRADLGDLDRAIADLDEAIRLDPTRAEAWFDRGKTRETKGDRNAASRDYTEAIRLDPRLAQAWINRGTGRSAQGDLDGALADLDEAVRLEPGLAVAWYDRGNTRKAKGDREGAIRDFGEAIRLDPRLVPAWQNRAIVRLDAGEVDGALADLDEAIRLEAGNADLYVARGVACERKGDGARAVADFEKALQLMPADRQDRKEIESELEKLRRK